MISTKCLRLTEIINRQSTYPNARVDVRTSHCIRCTVIDFCAHLLLCRCRELAAKLNTVLSKTKPAPAPQPAPAPAPVVSATKKQSKSPPAPASSTDAKKPAPNSSKSSDRKKILI